MHHSTTVGVDLAKNVIQVSVISARGKELLNRDRTPELEHVVMWEIQHIRLLPLRTLRAVSFPVNGAA